MGKLIDPQLCPDALDCPFCQGPATIESWHGGGPRKRMVSCHEDNDCDVNPMVCGSTRARALAKWNRRTAR